MVAGMQKFCFRQPATGKYRAPALSKIQFSSSYSSRSHCCRALKRAKDLGEDCLLHNTVLFYLLPTPSSKRKTKEREKEEREFPYTFLSLNSQTAPDSKKEGRGGGGEGEKKGKEEEGEDEEEDTKEELHHENAQPCHFFNLSSRRGMHWARPEEIALVIGENWPKVSSWLQFNLSFTFTPLLEVRVP